MPVCRGTLFWARPRRRCVLISRIFNIFWFVFFQSVRNWVIQNYFQSIGTVSATWQTGRGKVIRQHTITVICCSRNFYWAASSYILFVCFWWVVGYVYTLYIQNPAIFKLSFGSSETYDGSNESYGRVLSKSAEFFVRDIYYGLSSVEEVGLFFGIFSSGDIS